MDNNNAKDVAPEAKKKASAKRDTKASTVKKPAAASRKKAETADASKKKRSTAPRQPAPPKLKLLFTIVDRDKAELYTALLQSFEVNVQLTVSAQGTANTEMLQLLGLTESKKAVIMSVVREDRANEVLRFLDEKFNTIKNGKGIAYTVPMTGTIGVAIYQFLSNKQ